MLVPGVAELEQQRLGVLAVLRSPAQRGRPLVELHRHGRQPVRGAAVDRPRRRCSSLAITCGSSSSSSTACTGAHGASISASSVFHSSKVRVANSSSSSATHASACSRARPAGRRSAGRRRGRARPMTLAEVRPVAVGLEEDELDVATVLRPVGRRRAGSRPRRRPASRGADRPGARRARRTTASTSPSPAATRRRPSPRRCAPASAARRRSPKASAMPPLRSPIAPRWLIG